MATVKKRGNSYKITASCGYDMTGKQLRQHMTWTPEPGMTGRQIEKELERQKVLFEERAKAGTIQDGGIRFQAFAEKWLEDYGRKQLKLKTHTEYEKRLVRINQAIRLRDLKPGHLNSFYSNLAETGIRADKRYTCKIDLMETIKSQNMTRAAFAKSADISEATIRAIAAGRKINKESAAKVSKAIGVKLSELFNQEDPDRVLSSSTVRTYHRVISSILSKGVKWGYIPFNPAINADLPKLEEKEAVHLDETDARRLLELLHNEPIKYRAMITFDLLSGLRTWGVARPPVARRGYQERDYYHCTGIGICSGHGPLYRHTKEQDLQPAAQALAFCFPATAGVQGLAGRPAGGVRRLLER